MACSRRAHPPPAGPVASAILGARASCPPAGTGRPRARSRASAQGNPPDRLRLGKTEGAPSSRGCRFSRLLLNPYFSPCSFSRCNITSHCDSSSHCYSCGCCKSHPPNSNAARASPSLARGSRARPEARASRGTCADKPARERCATDCPGCAARVRKQRPVVRTSGGQPCHFFRRGYAILLPVPNVAGRWSRRCHAAAWSGGRPRLSGGDIRLRLRRGGTCTCSA